jgi:hypothetical protein
MKIKLNLLQAAIFILFVQAKSQNLAQEKIKLISTQEVMSYAFENSKIVMMNEAHSGLKRNIRTRIIGKVALPKAHSQGVRNLAMEALNSTFAEKANRERKLPKFNHNVDSGYLNQPEMRELMQLALDLGWELFPYEADFKLEPEFKNTIEEINWREKKQAENLQQVLNTFDCDEKLLVWCGNSHLKKETGTISYGEFLPMGYQFWQITGIEPFIIDQNVTVNFNENGSRFEKWQHYKEELNSNLHGTLGFITSSKSAKIISIHNLLE